MIFRADVEAQAGAYATGVLVLITSAAVAVTLAARKAGQRWLTWAFGVIALVFAYTTVANIIERPDGIKIASLLHRRHRHRLAHLPGGALDRAAHHCRRVR